MNYRVPGLPGKKRVGYLPEVSRGGRFPAKAYWRGTMDDLDAAASRGRGRPRKDIRRHVIRDLMEAAEVVLANKTSYEIKLHEIASVASVSEAMIYYYFGGKDGLMVAIFDELMREAPYRHSEEIINHCIEERSIRPLVEELANFYYKRSGLIRMTAVEMTARSSQVKDAYWSRYLDVTPMFVEKLVHMMVEKGIYRDCFDIKFVTSSLFSLIMGPIVFNSSKALNIRERLHTSELIDQITRFTDFAMGEPKATA
jgi:AcrR family transcriptional regulator